MGKHTNKLHKNRILHLKDDEVKNPILVAHDFFSASWLPNHIKMLRQWRNQVAFEYYNASEPSPASLLFEYELTIKLIEAAWLLKDKKLGNVSIRDEKDEGIVRWYLKKERKKLRDYPKNLKRRELIKPSIVLDKVFRSYKLADYREILNTWLNDALSTNFMEESLSKAEVITVYEQLIKLYEAMWLISERSKHID